MTSHFLLTKLRHYECLPLWCDKNIIIILYRDYHFQFLTRRSIMDFKTAKAVWILSLVFPKDASFKRNRSRNRLYQLELILNNDHQAFICIYFAHLLCLCPMACSKISCHHFINIEILNSNKQIFNVNSTSVLEILTVITF